MRSITLDGDIEPGEILEAIEEHKLPGMTDGVIYSAGEQWPASAIETSTINRIDWGNYADIDSSETTWTAPASDNSIVNYVIYCSTGATYGEVE